MIAFCTPAGAWLAKDPLARLERLILAERGGTQGNVKVFVCKVFVLVEKVNVEFKEAFRCQFRDYHNSGNDKSFML